jgi:hypothetical protein
VREPTQQRIRVEQGFVKPIDVVFDGESHSSDGGLVLLRAVDHRIGLTETLAACLEDRRDPLKVAHQLSELFRLRVFGIAAGYPDGNDAALLSADPVLKEVCGRRGVTGDDLASQSTLSRFEAGVTAREAVTLGRTLETFVVQQHRARLKGKAKRITIDLDPTEDRTYGQQTFSFFNGHYDSWCFLPQLGFLTFDDEVEQHLFHARLRPGNSRCWRGALPLLRRTVAQLRKAFPGAVIRVRLDAGFCCPRTLLTLEQLGVEYVVAMAGNKRLAAEAEPYLAKARAGAKRSGESAKVFGAFRYAPKDKSKKRKTWPRTRRIVVKAEVVVHPGREPRDNPRYVVTDLRLRPKAVYEDVYCGRGDVENRIKELNLGLALGRTSCSRYVSNQFRVLMTAAAYVLFQQLRLKAANTALGRAQVPTLRERLIKIGAQAVESVRRLVLHLPAACPWREPWRAVAQAVGVT